MSALVVFDFAGAKVRTAGNFDAPLFCAADVCGVLGVANVGDALGRLDRDEIENIVTTDAQGKNRPIAFVNESGLFSLILGSRKPNAKTFKKWVTSEVLPEIRKRGFFSVLESARAKQTERLLAECFPNLPKKSEPIFRELIGALLRLRREAGASTNPPWARSLARDVYAWAIHVEGQQQYRRSKNPKPNGSRVDHSMFGEVADEAVKRVVHSGTDFAKASVDWRDWKTKMELVFGKKALQLPMMVPMFAERTKEAG